MHLKPLVYGPCAPRPWPTSSRLRVLAARQEMRGLRVSSRKQGTRHFERRKFRMGRQIDIDGPDRSQTIPLSRLPVDAMASGIVRRTARFDHPWHQEQESSLCPRAIISVTVQPSPVLETGKCEPLQRTIEQPTDRNHGLAPRRKPSMQRTYEDNRSAGGQCRRQPSLDELVSRVADHQ